MPKLEAELDFELKPGFAALRIYRVEGDGPRELLRTQQLYNLAAGWRKTADPEYAEPDRRLLGSLFAELGKPAVLRANLNTLLLEVGWFRGLLARFTDVPERFRLHGAPYTTHGARATVDLELSCHGKDTLLAAMVRLPDGSTLPWSRVWRERTGPGNQVLLGGQLVTLDLPLGRDVLDRVFGEDNPRVPTATVEQYLPALINHRLDLVRGPAVDRETREGEPRLVLRAEGGDIALRPLVGEALVRPGLPCARLWRREQRFVVSEYRHEQLAALANLVQQLPLRPRANDYLLPGALENVQKLGAALAALPPAVSVEAPPELQGLLGRPPALTTTVSATTGRGWFQLDFGFRVGDAVLSVAEARRLAGSPSRLLRTPGGSWLQLDADQLVEALRRLPADLEGGALRRPAAAARAAGASLETLGTAQLAPSARDWLAHLKAQPEPPPLALPAPLAARLRPYQQEGVEFLYTRAALGVGALLADDMGLGKTVEVLGCLAALKGAGRARRTLVLCPASVLEVWRAEASRFTPELTVAVAAGPAGQRQAAVAAGTDLLVCSYASARQDADGLGAVAWDVVVLDEAQQIKNPGAQITQAVKRLPAAGRLALTGTPLENRLSDLWSILDFLNPGYLGTQQHFVENYQATDWRRPELRQRLQPLMLRRTKDQVAPELPSRTVEEVHVPLLPEQETLYQRVLADARQRLRGQGALEILAALTRLRQVCCDPRLLDDTLTIGSAKLECLVEMLEEITAAGHSVLVFSQFAAMLRLVAERVDALGLRRFMITGETEVMHRARLVAEFNGTSAPAVFLLSLRAAGTGLTLTRADYVVVYDPWWNPAVENQAIDRTHRIGQDKPVVAYRLLAADTVEQKVAALQEEKRRLFADIVETVEAAPAGVTAADLLALLDP